MNNDNNLNQEPWIGKLKEKINQHAEPVPPLGWESLEKELAPTPKAILIPHRRLYYSAAAAVIAALFLGSLYFLTDSPVITENQKFLETTAKFTPAYNQEVYNSTVETEEVLAEETSVAEKDIVAKNTALAKKTIIAEPVNMITTDTEDNNVYADDDSAIITENINQENQSSDVASEKNQSRESAQTRVNLSKPSGKDKYHLPVASATKKQKKDWSVGAAVSNAGSIANNQENSFSGRPYRVNAIEGEYDLEEFNNDQTIIFNDGIPYVYNTNGVIRSKHHQPISAGVNFRKYLKRGFSIETGLMFTLLSSDITLASNQDSEFKQKLYYLGIPLKANWNFLTSRFFTLYLGAGGQVEKCVSGKLGDEKLNAKPWQFSVMGGVGAQFNATKHVGIYVEPGVAYFFKNNSSIETIRKEHPFNFNMNAGIRLSY